MMLLPRARPCCASRLRSARPAVARWSARRGCGAQRELRCSVLLQRPQASRPCSSQVASRWLIESPRRLRLCTKKREDRRRQIVLKPSAIAPLCCCIAPMPTPAEVHEALEEMVDEQKVRVCACCELSPRSPPAHSAQVVSYKHLSFHLGLPCNTAKQCVRCCASAAQRGAAQGANSMLTSSAGRCSSSGLARRTPAAPCTCCAGGHRCARGCAAREVSHQLLPPKTERRSPSHSRPPPPPTAARWCLSRSWPRPRRVCRA